MRIVGPDSLVFGVDDLDACTQYLTDYGLEPVDVDESGGLFVALDGTGIEIRERDDPNLPPALETGAMLRETVYGVADEESLDEIEEELDGNHEVDRRDDGSLRVIDDMGFALRFQLTVRREIQLAGERVNAPGAPPQRPVNEIGADEDAVVKPRTLSHVVLFVPDVASAEAFYQRLGFVCTDRLLGAGPFLRPRGTRDHHTLFLIQTPPFMKGCEHFTFHLGGPTEVLLAGTRFQSKGYETFWGPGRHKMGSNWFWYFNSPFGCHVEYDADMDLHDNSWQAREAKLSADASQMFLFKSIAKWVPMGPPPKGGGSAGDNPPVPGG